MPSGKSGTPAEQNYTYPYEHQVVRWLGVAQLFWASIAALTLTLFLIGIPLYFEQLVNTVDLRSLYELGITAYGYAGYVIALNLIVIFAHIIIAAVIFFRRPNDWMALFVSFALVSNGALVPLSLVGVPAGLNPALWNILERVVTYIGLVSSVTLLYLFPNARFVPRWTGILALIWSIMVFFALFLPDTFLSFSTWPIVLQVQLLLIWAGTGVYAQIFRFLYRSDATQRQQTKWALLGLTAAVLGPFVYFMSATMLPSIAGPGIPNILYQRVGASFFAFSTLARLIVSTVITVYLLLFPISFAIAILRYRLWDIDILIRRTLIYSAVTGLLLVVYFSSVILMQVIFRGLTGDEQPEIVTVISTLAIASLFVPVRRRVQAGIDRRFYQRKYDAAQTLAAFNETVRNEVDLDQLCDRLLSVVEETMQPEHVSLWIRRIDDDLVM